ncbi:MAG: sulfotransferase domain-containing protein [Caulobacter sp.]|nr:sulfotransferase domain-containing protein [Caulobacter sp.]
MASTHSIPPNAAQWGWLRALAPLPPYAVVVRDIPDVLISNYEKWRERYGVSFSRYVAGDPWQKAYICDVWWYIRYLNQWGEVASRYPRDTMVMTYESFRDDPRSALEKIARQLRLDLSPAALDAGVAGGTKEAMAKAQDPDIQDFPVRADGTGRAAFSDEDRALMLAILDRHLRHDFGYGYFDKPRGFQI